MADLSFGELSELLRKHGYHDVTDVLFSKAHEHGLMVEETLAGHAIETMCEYGPVMIEFNNLGELYRISVKRVTSSGSSVDYSAIAAIIKREGFVYPTCISIIYSRPLWSSGLGNSQYRNATIYGQCRYGNATVEFNATGDLELVEIC
jgi:hypothetical protein